MFDLVTGGSASGKSEYAESLVVNSGARHRFYIATMKPWDEEGRKRIQKHRSMREGKGFETLEVYGRCHDLKFPKDSSVLLECLSNLTANLFYSPQYQNQELETLIVLDILNLKKQVKNLVIVTNEIFSDGISYDAETAAYCRILGQINQCLGKEADQVTEVVYGIPLKQKKEET